MRKSASFERTSALSVGAVLELLPYPLVLPVVPDVPVWPDDPVVPLVDPVEDPLAP
jgi:hypothetical protein